MIAALAVVVALLAPACYPPPVAASVSVPYVQPACAYCAGHRGLEYELATGSPVRAVASGTVTFAGVVAGTRYLVVLQPDGLRATYGMLGATSLTRGDVVEQGQVVGHSTVRLYFGLRNAADEPVDPTPLLGRLAGRPRLVPTDGSAARPAGAPRLVCAGVVSARFVGARRESGR
ncbi:MAG: M23 family metallopeptidase [Ilumatobacteraceae bacterium]